MTQTDETSTRLLATTAASEALPSAKKRNHGENEEKKERKKSRKSSYNEEQQEEESDEDEVELDEDALKTYNPYKDIKTTTDASSAYFKRLADQWDAIPEVERIRMLKFDVIR